MESKYTFEDIELARIVAPPLYFGLLVNIVAPVMILMVCYYLANSHYVTNPMIENTRLWLFVFGAMALAEAGLALWWRGKLLNQPMVRKEATFEADIARGVARHSRPVFLLIASISLYGYIYFFLTGLFDQAVFFVVLEFLVFQIVRPRYGLAKKVVERQKELVSQGRWLPSDPGTIGSDAV